MSRSGAIKRPASLVAEPATTRHASPPRQNAPSAAAMALSAIQSHRPHQHRRAILHRSTDLATELPKTTPSQAYQRPINKDSKPRSKLYQDRDCFLEGSLLTSRLPKYIFATLAARELVPAHTVNDRFFHTSSQDEAQHRHLPDHHHPLHHPGSHRLPHLPRTVRLQQRPRWCIRD